MNGRHIWWGPRIGLGGQFLRFTRLWAVGDFFPRVFLCRTFSISCCPYFWNWVHVLLVGLSIVVGVEKGFFTFYFTSFIYSPYIFICGPILLWTSWKKLIFVHLSWNPPFYLLILSSSFLSFSPLAFYRYRFISSLSFSHTSPTYLALLFASCSNWIDWENPPQKLQVFFLFPSRSGRWKIRSAERDNWKWVPYIHFIDINTESIDILLTPPSPPPPPSVPNTPPAGEKKKRKPGRANKVSSVLVLLMPTHGHVHGFFSFFSARGSRQMDGAFNISHFLFYSLGAPSTTLFVFSLASILFLLVYFLLYLPSIELGGLEVVYSTPSLTV